MLQAELDYAPASPDVRPESLARRKRGVMYFTLVEIACLAVIVMAQTTDTISGGAGWVGAGLLGAVLAWLLLVHLPAKDKQLRELTEAKDKQITTLIESFQKDSEMCQDSFTKRNDKALDTFAVLNREERNTYQKWHESNLVILNQLVLDQRDTRHALANLRHELGIKKATGEVVTGQYGPKPKEGEVKPYGPDKAQ